MDEALSVIPRSYRGADGKFWNQYYNYSICMKSKFIIECVCNYFRKMQIALNILNKFRSIDPQWLQEKLNENLEQIIFEMELLADYKEAKSADKSRFQNL